MLIINLPAVLIRNTAEPMEESIDYIPPFPGIVYLHLHPFLHRQPVPLRQIKFGQRLLHPQYLVIPLKVIIVNALNECSSVSHQERIGKPVEKQQVFIGTYRRIFVLQCQFWRILLQQPGSGCSSVDAHCIPVCPVVCPPRLKLISPGAWAVMFSGVYHPAKTERSSIFLVDPAGLKKNRRQLFFRFTITA